MKTILLFLFLFFTPQQPTIIETIEVEITENARGQVVIPLMIEDKPYLIKVNLNINVNSKYKKI